MALISNDAASPALQARKIIPVIGTAQAAQQGCFDGAGYPTGDGWDSITLNEFEAGTSRVYALEVSGDFMEPLYRAGDRLIVAPGAPVRRGDRVVIQTKGGEILVKELSRQTVSKIELKSFNQQDADRILTASDIAWIARIVWVSQ
jgi:phage repressor protein C with HTH and peptisase S24 domain